MIGSVDAFSSFRFRLDIDRLKFVSALGVTLWLGVTSAQAATFVVTNLNDSGPGSLRQTIIDARNQPGADTIEFASNLSGDLIITGTLEISGVIDVVGPGSDVLTIYGNGSSKNVFLVNEGAEVTISGLSITNGAWGINNYGTLTVSDCNIFRNYASGIHNRSTAANLTVNDSILSENNGAGIWSEDGATVTVNRSVLADNAEEGIYNDPFNSSTGIVVIKNSILSGNRKRGIVSSYGALTINNSTIEGNSTTSSDGGAGFYSYKDVSLTITNSTFANNTAASGCGGGMKIVNGTNIDFYNNTLSGNLAKWGGGLCIKGSIILNAFNSTLTNNSADKLGGGIYIDDTTATLVLSNSLVAGNSAPTGSYNATAGVEVYNKGSFNSQGYNLFGQNGTLGLVDAMPDPTDLTLSGPISTAIGTLANNGGPTQTHIAAAGSPILDAGNNSLVPVDATTDQRGEERIQDGTVEIGAVEGNNPRDDLAWRVTEIYIATLGYAPDNEGLQYWVDQMTVDPRWTPTTVAQSFFDQPSVQALYPVGNDDVLIDALYRNLFAREADTAGRTYWLDELAAARVERNQMVMALIEGGYANHEAIDDMARFANQVRIGLAFAAEQKRLGIAYSALDAGQQATLRDIGADLMEQATAEAGMRNRLIAQIPGLLAGLAR
jgi:hypothetical protein